MEYLRVADIQTFEVKLRTSLKSLVYKHKCLPHAGRDGLRSKRAGVDDLKDLVIKVY